jgi:hypothetical protein
MAATSIQYYWINRKKLQNFLYFNKIYYNKICKLESEPTKFSRLYTFKLNVNSDKNIFSLAKDRKLAEVPSTHTNDIHKYTRTYCIFAKPPKACFICVLIDEVQIFTYMYLA